MKNTGNKTTLVVREAMRIVSKDVTKPKCVRDGLVKEIKNREILQMKKYKYINIRQVNSELFEGKPVYRIFNNKSVNQIGIISYYKPWKEYVFTSKEDCVFNNGCLKDVLNFIENLI